MHFPNKLRRAPIHRWPLRFEALESRRVLAGDYSLLKDLNPTLQPNQFYGFLSSGPVTYIFAEAAEQWSLLKTDGTTSATVLLKSFPRSISNGRYLTEVAGTSSSLLTMRCWVLAYPAKCRCPIKHVRCEWRRRLLGPYSYYCSAARAKLGR